MLLDQISSARFIPLSQNAKRYNLKKLYKLEQQPNN
jgi:hypothetical protein